MINDMDEPFSELVTFWGHTASVATGTFSLQGDAVGAASGLGTVSKIVLPKGTTLKVWTRLLAGAGLTVNIQYAPDGSTFASVVSDNLAANGEVDNEKRRPHVFRSSAGTEAIQITWSGASTSTDSQVAFDMEFTQDR